MIMASFYDVLYMVKVDSARFDGDTSPLLSAGPGGGRVS